MLSEWLGYEGRCPECKPVDVCRLDDYALAFSKESRDGSGKATIVPRKDSVVYGRIFQVPNSKSNALDSAEGAVGKSPGYRRDNAFAVSVGGKSETMTTYIGIKLDEARVPYDWYLALIVAGAVQAGLPNEYIAALRGRASLSSPVDGLDDTELKRLAGEKQKALHALSLAGFESVHAVLKS